MEPQRPEWELELEPRADAEIARFTTQVILSGAVAEAAAERLAARVPQLGRRRLLVDFGNVHSLSSLMLGKLVELNKAAEAAGGRLALFNLSPDVREIFEVTGLDRVLLLYANESDALQ